MQNQFLIIIAVVFFITIVFGILIFRFTIKFEKKALEAKLRKEELEREMKLVKPPIQKQEENNNNN